MRDLGQSPDRGPGRGVASALKYGRAILAGESVGRWSVEETVGGLKGGPLYLGGLCLGLGSDWRGKILTGRWFENNLA